MASRTAALQLEELERAREEFHELLALLSAEQARAPSRNSGWTNGEVMSHITFGFVIVNALLPLARAWARLPGSWSQGFASLLNALTRPFNWVNGLGARGQARVFTPGRLGTIYDRAHARLMRTVGSIPEAEWQSGMFYPDRWDPNFKRFMTLQDLVRYPILHQSFHCGQLSLD